MPMKPLFICISSDLVLYYVTAEAYEAAGQANRARDWYQRILTIEPDDAQAQEALAQLAGV